MRKQSAVVELLSKDKFGAIWVSLLFLFVTIIRFWVLDPELIDAGNCIACVIGVVVPISALITLLLTVFWIFWAERAPITMGFFFILGGLGVLCAMFVNKVSQAFINILFQKGFITWQQESVDILQQQLVPHLSGLYLGSLMVFLAIRMLLVKEIQPRMPLVLASISVGGASAVVLFLGIKMY